MTEKKNLKKQLTLEEIKEVELNILIDFSEFCEKNNLRYYLTYGTLLGAVRHKGFIPWDDDIDVNMPRDDYDKLQTLLKNNNYKINDHIILKTPESKNYQYQFCKIIDNRTIVYEKNIKNKYQTSIWIDIFPLDNIPENTKKQKHFISTLIRKRKHYFYTFEKSFNGKSLIGKIKYTIVKIIMTPVCKLINQKCRIAKLATKYKNLETDLIFFSLNGDAYKTIFNKNVLEQTDLLFENRKFKTFKNYDKVLTQLFGNYMELPPVEQRISHSFEAYFI